LIGRGSAPRLPGEQMIAREAVIPSDRFPTRTNPTGVPGGQPAGAPETIARRANPEAKHGIRAQNDSLQQLADAGYHVIQQPKTTLGRDGRPLLTDAQQRALGLDPLKNPDALIEGRVFDAYAPLSNTARGVHRGIADKINDNQAHRLVVNLRESSVTPSELRQFLQANPIANLKEIKVIDQDGRIVNFFPFQR
jgi:Contact-dependent growth inhibition CdiA C-terminal domain